MKKAVLLSIQGQQNYSEQEPETVELVTEGVLEQCGEGWKLTYEESDLTGLQGVTTVFRVEPKRVILTRSGRLNSQMIFELGVSHDSLYQMEFGALLMTVTATHVFYDIVPDGGSIDLTYSIGIENTQAGVIDYHLDIRAK